MLDSAHFRSIYSGGDGYSARIGQLAFQVNSSLKIHEDSCLDSGGCICGRNENEINILCNLVKCLDEDVKCSGNAQRARKFKKVQAKKFVKSNELKKFFFVYK